jgi:hypothetical protein
MATFALSSTKTAELRSETRQLKRRFVSYSIRRNDVGRLELIDNYDELDFVSRQYVRREAVVLLPSPLAEAKLEAMSLKRIESLCNGLRNRLDRHGIKIFFDSVDGELRPKWRYRLPDGTRTDHMKVVADSAPDAYEEDSVLVPLRVIQLVRRNSQYHAMPEWKVWFGRKMQRKREEIMLDYLLNCLKNPSVPDIQSSEALEPAFELARFNINNNS